MDSRSSLGKKNKCHKVSIDEVNIVSALFSANESWARRVVGRDYLGARTAYRAKYPRDRPEPNFAAGHSDSVLQ